MSTQHRPTFHAAVGRTESGPSVRTFHFSSKDQAAHTKMKYRVSGQASSSDMINRDLVAELERREREFVAEKTKHLCAIEAEEKAVDTKLLMIAAAESIVPATAPVKVYDDADAEGSADGFDSSSDESDDNDEDDELELQRELEQIKRDREAVAAKKAEEERLVGERDATAAALKGNPLLNTAEVTSKVKRQWNDDVVFKNQSRGEPELKKRFVNDTIRSDFHRSFLKKYVR